jgi:glutathione S-transferase
MTGEGEMLILYEHPFALYCQKVLVALNELGVGYEVLEEQRDFDRADLAEPSRRRRSRCCATATR